MQLPGDLVGTIATFSCQSLFDASRLELVSRRWRESIQDCEWLWTGLCLGQLKMAGPPQELLFTRSRALNGRNKRTFSKADVAYIIGQAWKRRLAPITLDILTPIEECCSENWPQRCPFFAENLVDLQDVNRVNGIRIARLRCEECKRTLPAWAASRAEPDSTLNSKQPKKEDINGPFVRSRRRRIPALRERHVKNNFLVIDKDGATANRLQKRMFFQDISAGSLTLNPAFGFMAGSCAHWYEMYTATLKESKDAMGKPAGMVLESAIRNIPQPDLVYVFTVGADLSAATKTFPLSSWCSASRCKIFAIPDAMLAAGNDDAICEKILQRLDGWCGSETDEGSSEDDVVPNWQKWYHFEEASGEGKPK
jgi:hypothetical protein